MEGETMKKVVLFVVLCLTVGLGLTTWKMFDFRDRLHGYLDNTRWEETLEAHGCYGDDIVFFGDSEVALWQMCPSFGSMPIRNRGVSGAWASKSWQRYEKDVLSRPPDAVVILIGTNDRPLSSAVQPIEKMITSAQAKGVDVHVCSLLPVRGEYVKAHPLEQMRRVNDSLRREAADHGATYIDLFSAMADEQGLMRADYSDDGLHPNARGYAAMTRIVRPYLFEHPAR